MGAGAPAGAASAGREDEAVEHIVRTLLRAGA